MPKVMRKALSNYEKTRKKVETNRKFYLTLFGMITAIVLLWNGKIDAIVFKDVFVLSLACFSVANVVSKYLLQK